MNGVLLSIRDVYTHFPVRKGLLRSKAAGTVKAVDGVSLDVAEGEILGLVGESGCGKSTLARTILRLEQPTSGSVWFEGHDLASLSERELRALRPRLQLIFQDPYASLNPRMTVYDTIAEPLRVHRIVPAGQVHARVCELMEKVGLAPRLMRKYPHEFSGGQRQRIAVARALALCPALIVADEPVSALDVSVQAQILNLIAGLCAEEGLTLVLISHDLSVVKHLAGRIAVMYLGRIVEIGPAEDLFERPVHPYTRALISAVPTPDPAFERTRKRMLLRGDPPSPLNPPEGCPFHPRCPFAVDACSTNAPRLEPCNTGRVTACIRADELPA